MGRGDARVGLFRVVLALCLYTASAHAHTSNSSFPPALHALVPHAECVGTTRLRFFGLRIYDARLWASDEFRPSDIGAHPFALELTYHRNFAGTAIAQRSLKEMRRQGDIDSSVDQQWLAQLSALIPDVSAGTRLTGTYHPQHGLQLWRGPELLGHSTDLELARRFFGIWLSTYTSQPALRKELLGLEGDTCR